MYVEDGSLPSRTDVVQDPTCFSAGRQDEGRILESARCNLLLSEWFKKTGGSE